MSDSTPRRPLVAFLLGLLTPGLGHLYAGRPAQGASIWGGTLAATLLALLFVPATTAAGLLAVLALLLAITVGAAFDGARVAKVAGAIELRRYHRVVVYLGLFLVLGLGRSALIRPLLPIKTFVIASASMEPTLLAGDRVVADRRAFARRPPRRGEIVAFEAADPSEGMRAGRIVAIGGDTVEVRAKELFVGGSRVEESWAVHRDSRTYPPRPGETDPGSRRDQFGPATLGPSELFVLGDNRDFSYDSRFTGPIDRAAVKASLLYVYWSADRSRLGRSLQPPS